MGLKARDLSIDTLASWINEIGSDLRIDSEYLADRVRSGCAPGMSVSELLTLAAENASSLVTRHPDWATLGGRVLLADIELQTPDLFSEYVVQQGDLVSSEFREFVLQHKDEIDSRIDRSRDLEFSFFAIRTLRRSYLHSGERVQYLWMRVALAIHMPDLKKGFESYELMSRRYFTHATPTLFNAGYRDGQLASCFLMSMKDGAVEGIFETLKECAIIMHNFGGIGLQCSSIPASKVGIDRRCDGIVPMLRVFNNASRFVDQGGDKRPGAISITIEPWHADIFEFLDLKKNHGKEEYRARDLFYALWVPDLFMEKVKNDEDWYLFSSPDAPGLTDCCGEEFNQLYMHYVNENKFIRKIPARKLWASILDAQIETGNPSLLYKDSCNMKSNQQNLGTIKSSNLCTEIIEYSSPDEIAVCNLASLGLPSFVASDSAFDFRRLHDVAKVATRNLNNTIDRNYYPLKKCKDGNIKHRPLALGVQGLADVYFKMKLAFDSPEANELNKKIFETIHHGSLEASVELAELHESPYESYKDSPIQQGKLQCDLWGVKVNDELWNWTELRSRISKSGVYNSLLTAVMPTASTAQILGYTESIEPLTSNMYSRRTLGGEFQVVNKYMVKDLEDLGLWTDTIREEIIASNGSIQHLIQVPAKIRSRYKTAWELSMKAVIDQSVGRGPFIDQSQSLNLFLSQPSHRQLTSMHFNSWSRGLKTGIYYLRTRPAASPIPFTVSHETRKRLSSENTANNTPEPPAKEMCLINDSICESCT